MNKREKDEMLNLVVALDNLFLLVENMENILTKNASIEYKNLEHIKQYKEKLIENMNVIEETKDILLGINHLKISSERFNIPFI